VGAGAGAGAVPVEVKGRCIAVVKKLFGAVDYGIFYFMVGLTL
jgi:hypothetical protein